MIDNPCLFAAEPLDRASALRAEPGWLAMRLADPARRLVPLCKGDPLIIDGAPGFLSGAEGAAAAEGTGPVFLGLSAGAPYFAFEADAGLATDVGPGAAFTPLREAASLLDDANAAIIGHARWLLDWHRRHRFCAACGGPSDQAEGGLKRVCAACSAEHFPRSDPVAIVLAVESEACLLGRGVNFPPTAYSALAGYVEAAETPEACAVREIREEAGVVLTDVRYQFSQPWPFPASLMMGFIARAEGRDLSLDPAEIAAALWVERGEVRALLAGARREDLRLPPRFTIARRLIERWAASDD